MASSDPKKGGDLFDMAEHGTKMPNDAGNRVIPSVPRPDQKTDHPLGQAEGGLGAPPDAAMADNATDIPRHPKDSGVSGEVITGTGDELPGGLEKKHLHYGKGAAANPAAKGNLRDDKHSKGKGGELDREAVEGGEMEPAPGEEGEDQDTIRDRKQG